MSLSLIGFMLIMCDLCVSFILQYYCIFVRKYKQIKRDGLQRFWVFFHSRSEAESGRTNDAVIKAGAKLPTPQQLSEE